MLGSQVLDVLIGVVLIMAVVSLAASTMVEAIAAVTRQRGERLKQALLRLLGDVDIDDSDTIKSLSSPGLGTDRFPSYVSAEAFAGVVGDVYDKDEKEPPVVTNLRRAARRAGADVDGVKREFERQFDEAMQRVSGAYKRWSTMWLFVIGLLIAVFGNVSVYHVGEDLWNDTATRDAVVESASRVGDDGLDPEELDSIAATVDRLDEFEMPIGWTDDAKAEWGSKFTWGRAGIVLGWLVTAVLVTLGAPFWFDLLQRLIALRTSGKPPTKEPDGYLRVERARPTGPIRGSDDVVDQVLGLK